MRCLFCGSEQSSVVDKRAVPSVGQIRRRRECLKCHQRFTTYEKIAEFELIVIKRSGAKEAFDREKLRAGIARALEKRPEFVNLEKLVDEVIFKLKVKGKREIESTVIGQTVLTELKKIDPIAYLRFVSVYRQFQDPTDFSKELKHLKS